MAEDKEDRRVMDVIRRWLFPILLSGFMYQGYDVALDVKNETHNNGNEIAAIKLMLSDTLRGITKDVQVLQTDLLKNENRDQALTEKVDELRLANAYYKSKQFKANKNE